MPQPGMVKKFLDHWSAPDLESSATFRFRISTSPIIVTGFRCIVAIASCLRLRANEVLSIVMPTYKVCALAVLRLLFFIVCYGDGGPHG